MKFKLFLFMLLSFCNSSVFSQRLNPAGAFVFPNEPISQVSCTTYKSVSTPLKCICKKNYEIRLSDFDTIRNAWSTATHKELIFESCSFKEFDLANLELSKVQFRNVSDIFVESGVFQFSKSESVEVIFSGIETLTFSDRAFGPEVSSLIIDNVHLHNFSSGAFLNMSDTSTIFITNSRIVTVGETDETASVGFLNLKNVYFEEEEKVERTFLNISATDINFHRVTMTLNKKNSIFIPMSDSIVFHKSKLGFQKESSISAKSFSVVFNKTVLLEPLQKSLIGLVGANETSSIEFHNIELRNAAPGFLLTYFPKIIFKNITSEVCRCGQSNDFLKGLSIMKKEGVTFKLPDEEKLIVTLRNETSCKNTTSTNNTYFELRKICPNGKPTRDTAYAIIVGVLVSGLVIVVVVSLGFVYYFNDRIKKKYEMLKKWTFVLPAATYDRETVVKFDLQEQVKYISRPSSCIFSIDTNFAEEWRSSNVSIIDPPPPPIYENLPDTLPAFKVHQPLSPISEEEEEPHLWNNVVEAAENIDKDEEEEDEEDDDEPVVPINSKFRRIKTKKYRTPKDQIEDIDEDGEGNVEDLIEVVEGEVEVVGDDVFHDVSEFQNEKIDNTSIRTQSYSSEVLGMDYDTAHLIHLNK